MKTVIYVFIAIVVLGLGFWAYKQNYTTQAVLRETEGLQRDIAALRENLTVLRAEWAYLNRPERLRDLADLNFDRLKLLPFAPEQFGRVEHIDYPRPPEPEILDIHDVQGTLVEEAAE